MHYIKQSIPHWSHKEKRAAFFFPHFPRYPKRQLSCCSTIAFYCKGTSDCRLYAVQRFDFPRRLEFILSFSKAGNK